MVPLKVHPMGEIGAGGLNRRAEATVPTAEMPKQETF